VHRLPPCHISIHDDSVSMGKKRDLECEGKTYVARSVVDELLGSADGHGDVGRVE
jgi:hypothetical protein